MSAVKIMLVVCVGAYLLIGSVLAVLAAYARQDEKWRGRRQVASWQRRFRDGGFDFFGD